MDFNPFLRLNAQKYLFFVVIRKVLEQKKNPANFFARFNF